MKILLLFLYVLTGVNALAQTNKEDKKFSVQQVLSDLDSLRALLISVHPKLYATADSVDTEKAWQAVRHSISQPMSKMEFHKAVAPLVHQYNDGHTYLDIDLGGSEFEAFKKSGGKMFPVVVTIQGNRLIVVNDEEHTIAPGSIITAINGVATKNLLTSVRKIMSGDNAENLNANCSRLFSYLLWFCYKWNDVFEITYINNKDKRIEATVAGMTTENYFKIIFPSPLWTMKLYAEESLAVIECSTYGGNLERIKQKLDSFFTLIKEQNIKHVALDLRRNSGGNSYIGNVFLSYITKQPFAAIKTKSYRNSKQFQNFPDSDWRKKDIESFKISASEKNGFLSTSYDADLPTPLTKPDVFFTGKFYLLTSARTYSSAHMTALQVKCSGIGVIVGQPTGEQVDLTGEIKDFVLPHTQLVVWIPMAMYTAACNLPNKIGVQPDFYVAPTLTDIRNKQDAEVEFIKKHIRLTR